LIYEYPPDSAPIRQGDIFFNIPRIDISLQTLAVIDADGQMTAAAWSDIAKEGSPVAAVAGIRPVAAIVATQDCDAARAPDVTLCEIRPFQEVERKSKDTKSPKSWVNIITQQARLNQKWFYLPPDARLGFDLKMGADFMVMLRVRREDLENLRSHRRGRLNDLAEQHFRERIAEFFRRYPYDEWYPLMPDEMEAYSKEYPDAVPFPWQQP
jgi:hypothetical protein